ncbi:type II toxin-antitoxin system RelB/DinJ family antitoxin [Levilactobacillus koreensis]|nr:type II toxin-antitoxin system RelB/DinJ family antitoxin [Levilactobacillus koreensis]
MTILKHFLQSLPIHVLQSEYKLKEGFPMAAVARIQVRIDADIKKKAESKLKQNGLTISDFTRIMMTNVANGKLDHALEIVNQEVNDSLQEVLEQSSDQKLQGYSDLNSLNTALFKND